MVGGPAVGLPRILSWMQSMEKEKDMTVKMPRYIFESAAAEADIDDVRLDAADDIQDCFSKFCPAIVGSEWDLLKFFGMIVYRLMEEDEENTTEATVTDLAERMVMDSMGRNTIFGFAGLELTG